MANVITLRKMAIMLGFTFIAAIAMYAFGGAMSILMREPLFPEADKFAGIADALPIVYAIVGAIGSAVTFLIVMAKKFKKEMENDNTEGIYCADR